MPVQTSNVLDDVYRERVRQEKLVGQKFDWTAAQLNVPGDWKLRILVEEIGEVARAIHDDQPAQELYEELVQVAAIAVAWGEALLTRLANA